MYGVPVKITLYNAFSKTTTLLVSTVALIVSENKVKFMGSVGCHYRATHCEFQNELDSLLKQS